MNLPGAGFRLCRGSALIFVLVSFSYIMSAAPHFRASYFYFCFAAAATVAATVPTAGG